MLVAPIYTPQQNGSSGRMIWLPGGTEWWDVTRSKLTKGDQTFYSVYTLDEFPVFYRAGSIIPFYPVRRTVVNDPGEIILKVVPGADGTGRFYEDSGDNQDYKGDAWTMTTFTQHRTSSAITLTIGARQGSYDGMLTNRIFNVVLPDGTKQTVTYIGQEVSTSFN